MRWLITTLLASGLLLLVLAINPVISRAGEPGPGASPGPQRRIALVVGNGTYEHLPRLANPPNDARLIGDTLQDLGFELIGGGPQMDLDKTGFDRVVESFGEALQHADVGLFYYAGHGLQVQGVNWLVPIGADPVAQQDLDFQMVDAQLILKQMQLGKTHLNIVILDACRNNPFGGRGLRAVQSGLAEMRAPEGTLIAYATQPGNVASDGTGDDSPFSLALATALRQPGLDVFRLFNQVGLAVKRETAGEQQPWVSNSPIEGDFYFAGDGTSGTPTTPPVAPNVAIIPPEQKEALLAPQPNELRPQTSLFAASVRALNQVSHRAELTYGEYIRSFNPDRGPTGKETFVSLGRIADTSPSPELFALKQALRGAPSSKAGDMEYLEVMEPDLLNPVLLSSDLTAVPDSERLPELAKQYVDAADKLIAVFTPAEIYYRQGDFKDDHFAKGRAIHADLVAAFRDFLRSSELMRASVQNISATEHESYIKSLKADGRVVQYLVTLTTAQSRRLVDYIRSSVAGGKDIRSIDLAGLKAQIDLTEQRLTDLRQLVNGDPKAAEREYGLGADSKMVGYIEATAALVTESKYLWRSVRDKQPLDQQIFTISGGYESDIIDRFNQIVYQANDIR